MRAGLDSLLAEIRRNENLKEIFYADISLGKLQVDSERKLFHIDNGYFRVSDLAKYSIYAGEPRNSRGDGDKVWEDIYFSFTLRDGNYENQERRVRMIATLPCFHQIIDGNRVVEPPIEMENMKKLFAEMIDEERERLMQLEEMVAKPENQERYRQILELLNREP